MAVCGICNRTFESKKELEDHKSLQHTRKKHGKTITYGLQQEREESVKECSEDRVWTCGLCNEIFGDKQLLLSHKIKHEVVRKQEKKKQASISITKPKLQTQETVIKLSKARTHLKTRTGEDVAESHDDNILPDVTAEKDANKSRTKKTNPHKNVHKKTSKVEQSEVIQRSGTPKKEQANSPGSKVAKIERPYSCQTCGKSYIQKKHLKVHEATHSGAKPFKCTYCNKSFGRKDNLDQHELVHTGSGGGPYPCTMCDRKYARKENLTRHLKTHDGQTGETVKPFGCKACSKKFTYKKDMLQHERTHTGEKPFRCKECGMKFAREGTLTRHQRTHTGERLFKCLSCKYATTRKALLVQHQGKSHPEVKSLEIEHALTRDRDGMTFFKAYEDSDDDGDDDEPVADTVHVKCKKLPVEGDVSDASEDDPLGVESKPAVDDEDICDGLLEAEDLFQLPERKPSRRLIKAPNRLDV